VLNVRRRLGVVCVAAVLAGAAPAPAQEVAEMCPSPPYGHNQLNSSALQKYPVIVQTATYAIRAHPGLQARARKVAAILDAYDLWKQFGAADRLGRPLTDDSGRFPFFVLPMADLHGTAPGYTATFCDRQQIAYVAVGDFVEDEAGLLDDVVVHETFHAFQGYPDADLHVQGWWWTESTAGWAESLFNVMSPSRVARFDREFIGRPQVTLGTFSQAGTYRFTQHLAAAYGSPKFYAFLRRTFNATAYDPKTPVAPSFSAIEQEAARDGINLEEQLGAFWGAHLADTPNNGPAAPVATTERVGASRDSATLTLSAERLAAGIGMVDVRSAPPGSRVTVAFPGLEKATYVWYRAGGGIPERVRASSTRYFCTADLRGDGLRVAFTNGDQPAHRYQLKIDLEEDHPACRPPRECPAPSLSMPRRTAPHNGRMFDFVERVRIRFSNTLEWAARQTDLERTPRRTRAARRASRARIAHWWRCGAGLIARVDNPAVRRDRSRRRRQVGLDPVLRRERAALVRDMRRVAAATERGRVRDAVRSATSAGNHLGTLLARRLACEFHGYGNRPCPLPKKNAGSSDPASGLELEVPEQVD